MQEWQIYLTITIVVVVALIPTLVAFNILDFRRKVKNRTITWEEHNRRKKHEDL